jgi:hypothetical protein
MFLEAGWNSDDYKHVISSLTKFGYLFDPAIPVCGMFVCFVTYVSRTKKRKFKEVGGVFQDK